MNEFLSFAASHWPLVTAFFILLILIVISEVKAGGSSFHQLDAQQVVQQINHDKATLFDIRDKADYRKGHIANAISTNKEKLLNKKAYQKKAIILVCQSGQQSVAAQQALLKEGFESVQVLKGGINGWLEDGLPLIQAKAANN